MDGRALGEPVGFDDENLESVGEAVGMTVVPTKYAGQQQVIWNCWQLS